MRKTKSIHVTGIQKMRLAVKRQCLTWECSILDVFRNSIRVNECNINKYVRIKRSAGAVEHVKWYCNAAWRTTCGRMPFSINLFFFFVVLSFVSKCNRFSAIKRNKMNFSFDCIANEKFHPSIHPLDATISQWFSFHSMLFYFFFFLVRSHWFSAKVKTYNNLTHTFNSTIDPHENCFATVIIAVVGWFFVVVVCVYRFHFKYVKRTHFTGSHYV